MKIVCLRENRTACVLGIAGISVLIVAFYCNLYFPKQFTIDQEINTNPRYLFSKEADYQKPPHLQQHIATNASQIKFATEITAQTNIINLLFYYKCKPDCGWLSLELDSPKDKTAIITLAHPVLDRLDWFYVEDNGVLLYQKEYKYPTIQDLLASGVDLNKTELDPGLAQLLPPGVLPNVKIVNQEKIRAQTAYVISSDVYARSFWGWRMFQRRFDLQSLRLTGNRQLVWKIRQENKPNRIVLLTKPYVSY